MGFMMSHCLEGNLSNQPASNHCYTDFRRAHIPGNDFAIEVGGRGSILLRPSRHKGEK